MGADIEHSISTAVAAVTVETDFSGVVSVSRNGDVLFETARGYADRAHQIENTMGTHFATASATKGLTALAVMSVVNDGALNLDTSIRDLLSEHRELDLIDPSVTVRHLLSHTSGIGDYLDEDTLDDMDGYIMPIPVHQLGEPLDYLAVLGGFPTKFAAGERFGYCNGGYVILAIAAEVASGVSYYDLVRERVTDPAGMSSTAFLRSDQLPDSAALGYIPADTGPGWRTNMLHLPVRGCGDGGAYSTAADYSSFWPSLLAGRVLPESVVGEMWRAHTPNYGFGFWLNPNSNTVMSEGCDAGVSFRSTFHPATGVIHTVISNTSSGAWPVIETLDDLMPALCDGG